MTYTVEVHRTMIQAATITVEADDPEEASDAAMGRILDDDAGIGWCNTTWDEVFVDSVRAGGAT